MTQTDLLKYHFEKIELEPSSNIKEVWYDRQEKLLWVHFVHSKNSYVYYGIEPALIENWKMADSVGSFFSEYIKFSKFEKVE